MPAPARTPLAFGARAARSHRQPQRFAIAAFFTVRAGAIGAVKVYREGSADLS